MGRIRNKQTGESVTVADADAVAAVAGGDWESLDGVAVQQEHGSAAQVDPSQLENRAAMDPALRFQTADERNELERGAWLDEEYGGAGDKALTLGAGIASGASLGLTDLLGGEDAALRAEANPGYRTAGVVGGAIGASLVSGGAAGAARAVPAIAAVRAGAAVGRGVAGVVGKGVASSVAAMATEGAIFGAGQAFGEVALRDPELSAEAVLEAVGPGALLGGATGAAFGGVVGAIGKGAAKLTERSSVSAALDMSSPAGKAYATGVATKHAELDDLGRQIMARNGATAERGELAQELIASDFAEVGSQFKRTADQVQDLVNQADSLALAEAPVPQSPLVKTKVWKDGKQVERFVSRDSATAKNLPLESQTVAPQPVTNARDAVMNMKAQLDELGDLTPDVLRKPNTQALMTEYVAAANQLADVTGMPKVGLELAESLQLANGGINKAAYAGADVALGRAAANKLSKLRTATLDAFGGKITPQTIARTLRGAKEDFLPALSKLDEYYKGVRELAKHSDDVVALKQFETGLADMAEELAAKSGMDPKLITVSQVAAAFGVSELPDFEGPVDNLLKYAAMSAILGGRVGARVARGLGYNLRRQMFTRGLMGATTSAISDVPGLSALSAPGKGAVRGATAAASYNIGGRLYDHIASAAVNTASVESRITAAVEKIAKGVKHTPKALPGIVELSGMMRSDDGPDATDDQDAFVRIQDTLSKVMANPAGANMTIYEALRPVQTMNQMLADEMSMKAMEKYAYAYDKMPKDPGTMDFMGKSLWKPTDRELYTFAADLIGVFAPTEAMEGIADGVIPPQAAEAIRATNPAMFRYLQAEIMANADAIRENADFDQMIALGVAFDVPLHPMSDPRYTAWKQEHWAEYTAQMQDAMSNAPNAGANNEPEPQTAAQQMIA